MGFRQAVVAIGRGMNKPRSGDGARRWGLRGCHTRAAFHGSFAVRLASRPWRGGWSKVQSCTWRRTTAPLLGRFFSCSPHFRAAGADRRAERCQPSCCGLRPPKRCAASPPRPCRNDPVAIAGRVCDHAQGLDFRCIIFPFLGQLLRSYDLQGNNGNMGTSYIKQAESLAYGG